MKNSILVLGRAAEFNAAGQITKVPNAVKVWVSKWERDLGDVITYEGEKWTVMSTGFDSENDAREVMNGMTNLYKRKGFWKSIVSQTAKF